MALPRSREKQRGGGCPPREDESQSRRLRRPPAEPQSRRRRRPPRRRPNPSLASPVAAPIPLGPLPPPPLSLSVCVSRKRRGVDPCLSSVAWQKQTARSQTGSPPAGSLLLVRRRRWLAILRWRAAPLRQTRPPRSARAWMMLLRRCSGQVTAGKDGSSAMANWRFAESAVFACYFYIDL